MTSSTTAGSAHLDTSTQPPLLRITGDLTLAHYANLKKLSEKLDGCIGCGCLSLDKCALYNRDDRAATKGVIHPNNAARRKSRLAQAYHKAYAAE